MKITYYPNKKAVETARTNDDPLLVLVAYDESEIIASNADDAMEHSILLKKAGTPEREIDRFYRIVLNSRGADWTFVCPADYNGIPDRNRRIESFYNNGIDAISKAVIALGYSVHINIPDRYRRHFDTLKGCD
jgi:hypothetical protein